MLGRRRRRRRLRRRRRHVLCITRVPSCYRPGFWTTKVIISVAVVVVVLVVVVVVVVVASLIKTRVPSCYRSLHWTSRRFILVHSPCDWTNTIFILYFSFCNTTYTNMIFYSYFREHFTSVRSCYRPTVWTTKQTILVVVVFVVVVVVVVVTFLIKHNYFRVIVRVIGPHNSYFVPFTTCLRFWSYYSHTKVFDVCRQFLYLYFTYSTYDCHPSLTTLHLRHLGRTRRPSVVLTRMRVLLRAALPSLRGRCCRHLCLIVGVVLLPFQFLLSVETSTCCCLCPVINRFLLTSSLPSKYILLVFLRSWPVPRIW